MSVYRSTNALNKLFGITQAQDGLLNERSAGASYHFLTGLGQDVTPIGYSTRLQLSDYQSITEQAPKLDNLDAALSTRLKQINTIICKLTENKRKNKQHNNSNLPVIITHNFTKAEIDISAKSPLITAILEEAFSGDPGKLYRNLAWEAYNLLKSASDETGGIYLYNGEYSTVTALTNDTALQLHIEKKTGKTR